MVPQSAIDAWGKVAPWAEPRQVEQDLILSRALVELFKDPFLRQELRFRGGTALNKVHFPKPYRYSEDIDLVRVTKGPIGPILDRIRPALESWLGKARYEGKEMMARLKFRIQAEDGADSPIRLKVEINTVEIETFDPPLEVPFRMDNPWFSGEAAIATYSPEEMLATKLRALLQRDKGRDLFDLAHGLEVFDDLDADRIIACFDFYHRQAGLTLSRAEAESRMFAKLIEPTITGDLRPLLSLADTTRLTDESIKAAFTRVFVSLVSRLPGERWARTEELAEKFGIEVPNR